MNKPSNLLESLEKSLLDASRHQPGVEEAPVAVLWTDADSQWLPILPLLQQRLPQLITLGSFDASSLSGPAIWIRCVLTRSLEVPKIPPNTIPIVYMPGVSRQSLRAGEECPATLQPLIELQFRGAVWAQRNGKDWTVEAFLVSEDGLGLDLARDNRTKLSIQASLAALAEAPLSQLTAKRLEAEDFDRLVVGDHPRDLLVWMSDPQGARARWDSGRWYAFCSRCKSDYAFDPESDGEFVAGERLGIRVDRQWGALWDRFCESPQLFPGIPDLLIRSKPPGKLAFEKETWPDENERAEIALREALLSLENRSGDEARKKIAELESEHGVRRQWVWSRMGLSPLSFALEHLSRLAQRSSKNLGGDSADEMARLYIDGAFRADDAVLCAIACVRSSADTKAVQSAIRAMYLPWADEVARRLQTLIQDSPPSTNQNQETVEVPAGHCLFFADGLRFDLAVRFAALCEERGLQVSLRHRWAGLPTVTSTAKPAVSPLAFGLDGKVVPEDFRPSFRVDGQTMSTDRFRRELGQRGYTVLTETETGNPADPKSRAWCESGQIDTRGHELQAGLARIVDEELQRLVERVVALFDAGWRGVRIVTDHGWLLLPGGLPKQELPHYLALSKWSRCAAIKGNSKVSVPRFPWHWNSQFEFATPFGIASFIEGNDYAHGGVSLQECVVPDLLVQSRKKSEEMRVRIADVRWMRLRCRVSVEPATMKCRVDIRTKPADPGSSIVVASKLLDAEGRVDLLVENEDLAGSSAVLVVTDLEGRILTKESTIVGGESSS